MAFENGSLFDNPTGSIDPGLAPPEEKGAEYFVPANADLDQLRAAAAGCRGCPLYKTATQTVFGEGPTSARVVFVGEQPGDKEDLAGRPFVGPAGQLFNAALVEAGLDRETTYVTNAVKHFKWIPSYNRRLHQKPNRAEVRACHPWLQAEMQVIKPTFVVCLGATAAQALLGASFRLTKHRGELQSLEGFAPILATLHPAAILRTEDPDEREQDRLSFVRDLRFIAERI